MSCRSGGGSAPEHMAKRKQTRAAELITLPPRRLRDAAGRLVYEAPERKVWMSAQMAEDHRMTVSLIGKLKSGNGLSMADLERYAPAHGQRVLKLILALHDLKSEEWAKVKQAAARTRSEAAARAARVPRNVKRNRQIRTALAAGRAPKQVAADVGLSVSQVRRIGGQKP